MKVAWMPAAALLAAAGLALRQAAPAPEVPGASMVVARANAEVAADPVPCAAGDEGEADRLALLAGSSDPLAHQAAHELGKVADPKARLAMRRLARSGQELVAGNAIRGLGRIADPRDVPLFADVIATRPGTRSWHEAVRALGRVRTAESRRHLVDLLDASSTESERLTVLFALGESADEDVIPAIGAFLAREGLTVAERAFAERAAGRCIAR